MMDLGATICTPKSPACGNCPWADDCAACAKGLVSVLPTKLAKKKVPARYGHVYWIENGKGSVLVRQRLMKGLLAGMTEFPSSDWLEQAEDFAPPLSLKWKRVMGIVEHTFTHFHLELVVWRARKKTPVLNGRFVAFTELEHEALPSLMRKVAGHVFKRR
jgi:A/G-specific adenine glycosylase